MTPKLYRILALLEVLGYFFMHPSAPGRAGLMMDIGFIRCDDSNNVLL